LTSRLFEILVDPASGRPLERVLDDQGAVLALRGESETYPVVDGIPRLIGGLDPDQAQTSASFGFKWTQPDSFSSEAAVEAGREWFLQRYGFDSSESLREHLAARSPVLDVGCGSGYSSSMWLDRSWNGWWIGMDVSTAVDAARERLGGIPGTDFVQADVGRIPFEPMTFGAVIAEGVLHHTPSTRDAFRSVASTLRVGGELLLYVYRRKGPVREFTDGYIRDAISGLDPSEALDLLRPLTRLAKRLSDLQAEVEVDDEVELLGIPRGRIDVQRLLYWHFAKLFWDDARSFDENNLVNFDWYHPRYAHTQTPDEVRSWCDELGLEITHFDVQESGITLRAVRGELRGEERPAPPVEADQRPEE
jgi:arsenite methyltransferase